MAAEPGSYRPLEPGTLYLPNDEWEAAVAERPIHLASPFPEPESRRTIPFEVEPARDFAPERAQQANVYEAVAAHARWLPSYASSGLSTGLNFFVETNTGRGHLRVMLSAVVPKSPVVKSSLIPR